MRLIKIYPYAALFFAVLCFASCNVDQLDFDNIETPPYKATVVASIGETTYTIDSLIASISDSIETETGPTGQLSIIYRDTTLFDDPDEFLTIGDVSNNGNINPNITIPGSPSDQDVDFSQDLTFDYQPDGGEELDSVYFGAGDASISVNSTFDADADIELKLFSITNYNTGDTMVFNGTVPANGTLNLNQSLEFFRAHFNLINGVNSFSGQFNGTLHVQTGDNINASDQLTYTLSFSNPEFKGIFGYFGEEAITLPGQTIEFDVFNDIEPGGLEFNNAEIILSVDNSFGIPMGLNLDQVSSSNTAGTQVVLNGSVTQGPQTVRAPKITSVGGSLPTTITIDKDNSNINDLFNISPNFFNFSVTGSANFGNDSDPKERNFLTDSSKVETVIEVRMPLDFKLEGFTINADFDFEIGTDSLSLYADTLKLRIKSENQMPINGSTDIEFVDASGTVLLQKTGVQVISSPEVPAIGKIEYENRMIAEDFVVLNNEDLEKIQGITKIKMVVNVDSWEASNGEFVKIYSDYELVMKLSAIGNINYDL